MSGGNFNYDQYKIGQIADQVEHLILTNMDEIKDEYGYMNGHFYSDATIEKFNEAVRYLRIAQIYAQRIDWLVSADDGEDSFLKRLKEDLREIGK